MHVLYWIVLQISRVVLSIYFRRIRHIGRFKIPQDRPIILVANHPSDLVDALLLGSTLPDRTVYFWVKSTVFKNRVINYILHSLGMIPVKRRLDIKGNPESKRFQYAHRNDSVSTLKKAASTHLPSKMDNSQLYDKTLDLLHDNGTLLLFPEGTSHSMIGLKPLKDGTSFAALEYMARYNSPITLIPVGINYIGNKDSWKCSAVIEWGSPLVLKPADFNRRYLASKKTVAKELTAFLKPKLASVIIDILDLPGIQALQHNPDVPITRLAPKEIEHLTQESRDTLRAFYIGREIFLNSSLNPNTNKFEANTSATSSKTFKRMKNPNADPIGIVNLAKKFVNVSQSDSSSPEFIHLRKNLLEYSDSLEKLYLSDIDIAPPMDVEPHSNRSKPTLGLQKHIKEFFKNSCICFILSPLLVPGYILHLPIYYIAHFAGKQTPFSEAKSTRQIMTSVIATPIVFSIYWSLLANFSLFGFGSFGWKLGLVYSCIGFAVWLFYGIFLSRYLSFVYQLSSLPFFLAAIFEHPKEYIQLQQFRKQLVPQIAKFIDAHPNLSKSNN